VAAKNSHPFYFDNGRRVKRSIVHIVMSLKAGMLALFAPHHIFVAPIMDIHQGRFSFRMKCFVVSSLRNFGVVV
jgi:hypothetical protein